MRKIIGAILCLCPLLAFSADWVEIYNRDGIKGFIERENIVAGGPGVRIYWKRHDPHTPQQTAKGIEARIVSREMVNCQSGQQAILSVFYYSPDNKLIRKSEFNKNMVRFEPIQKGTLGDIAGKFVCSQALKK